MRSDEDSQYRTLFCGNLSEEVTDGILYELFSQAGPVECVRRPKDQNGRPKSFGFIIYKHECSVPYAVELFKGTKLFNRLINPNSRDNHLEHIPVLDTHLTEFTGPQENRSGSSRRYHNREIPVLDTYLTEFTGPQENKSGSSRRYHNREENRGYYRSRISEDSGLLGNPTENRFQDCKVSTWSELKSDPNKASRFISNGIDHNYLQSPIDNQSHSMNNFTHPIMPDFNALLQLGQQMIIPGMMGLPGMSGGLGPSLGNMSFPSMQGRVTGGDRQSPSRERASRDYYEDCERRVVYNDRGNRREQDRERRDFHDDRGNRRDEGRESRRNHPYNDRHHSQWEDHKRHDRGYSSSRSSHDRERRDRRSR